jgi:hypothetical protein
MTQILPRKSPLRAGRFKKKLVSESELRLEAAPMMEEFFSLHNLLLNSKITEAEFTAAYILIYLSHRFPHQWLGAYKKAEKIKGLNWRELPFKFHSNILKRLEGVDSIQDIFSSFTLKSTPFSVNRAVVEWSKTNYQLVLMFRVPKPYEVLEQQKSGRRCVTAILDERITSYILGERDALSFLMHDLIHADHFFFKNDCFHGQLGFYGLLSKTFDYFNLEHPQFATEFEYVMADMNAYAIHLLKCLKSAMIHYFDKSYFENWCPELNPPEALSLLNTKDYHPQTMDEVLLTWLSNFREKSSL